MNKLRGAPYLHVGIAILASLLHLLQKKFIRLAKRHLKHFLHVVPGRRLAFELTAG